uniref:Uncharacterized protein n=1 Tax=Theileria annulata TaxID=5874 RepID=A0A3B0N6J2_THEAN
MYKRKNNYTRIHLYNLMVPKKITDYDVLKKHYTFLNDKNDKTWESNLVSICDLSRYKSGDIALRWRSANEVVEGKCENICANVTCSETTNLSSYEVLFNYIEHETKKQALVKVRVCPECSYKLNYKSKHKKSENLSNRLYNKMSTLPNNFEDPILNIFKRFESFEHDLLLVEQKVKNELRCVYDLDVFDIAESIETTKTKIHKLFESLNELYVYKRQMLSLIKSQVSVFESLAQTEGLNKVSNNKNNEQLIELAKSTLKISAEFFDIPDNQPVPIFIKFRKQIKNEEPVKETIEFIPVTEAQFESVPALVKRRAKLEQVNELYKYLHDHALKRTKCVPVKINDIENEGIKVHGQTGSSKIAILRHLKKIQVINRDNTILLLDSRFKNKKTLKQN